MYKILVIYIWKNKWVLEISHFISSFVNSDKNLGVRADATVCALIRTSLYLVWKATKSRDPMVLSPILIHSEMNIIKEECCSNQSTISNKTNTWTLFHKQLALSKLKRLHTYDTKRGCFLPLNSSIKRQALNR